MKKIYFLTLLIFCFGLFVACSKTGYEPTAQTVEHSVSQNLSNIEGIESFDDETIKALSVVVRTNIKNNNLKQDNSNNEINERILFLTKQTEGEILSNSDKIEIENIDDNYTWEKNIKKYELLKFLNKKNISLSNISNIEPSLDESGKLNSLNFGGKNIEFKELQEEFGLESNKITNIENNVSSITIYGKGKIQNSPYFNIKKAQNLSNEGKNYKELLNHFFNGSTLKTD